MPKVAKLSARPKGSALSAETCRQAVYQADIAIAITDAAANILYCNAAFEHTTGYSTEAAVGRNQSMLSNKSTPVALYEAMWAALTQGQSWHGRLLNKRSDGSPYLAELEISPVFDGTGKVQNYLGMHRDVTEMHQLEQRAANQKRLIETVVDAAPMAIALLDARRKVILDNHAYKALVTDLGVAEPAHLLLDAMEARNACEVRIERSGGRAPRWYSCTTQRVEMQDESADGFFAANAETAVLLVASDVTKLREEQEKARSAALKTLLIEEEHAANLRDSLSAALYQIEEPINVIASAVALMRGRGDTVVSGVLDGAIEEARTRIDAMRAFAPEMRPREESAVGINLNEVLRDVLEIVTPRLLTSGITVDWRPAPVLPSLLGSPLQLRLACKTLLDNAIEAIDKSGRQKRSGRRDIVIVSAVQGSTVVLTLDDSGPGIPPELRLKVFEPFFSQSTGKAKHLGMGLARAQQIIADHAGTIEILDAPAGGCRIRVELPAGAGRR